MGRREAQLAAAREVLLDCLANQDAGHRWCGVYVEQGEDHGRTALWMSVDALRLAAKRLGITEADPDDDAAIHEEAVELLTQRIETKGARQSARPL